MSTIVKRTSLALTKQDLKNIKFIMKLMKLTQSAAIKLAVERYAKDLTCWSDPQSVDKIVYRTGNDG